MIKVNNAIILAAGRGSRLKHLTDDVPKPLLAPRGITFIEGIISNLKEKGINDIYVVTGYKSEKFDFLKDKGIKLIHNPNWDKGNNVTSIQSAIDHIGNSLIINGDIIMKDNVFQSEYEFSLTYVEQDENIDEWIVEINDEGNVINFDKDGLDKKGLYQREVIFVTKELSEAIKEDIKTFDMEEYQEYLMIQAAMKNNIPFKTFKITTGTMFDLDTIEEFNKYKEA